MTEAKWYVVHTYSGYEGKVADNLQKIVDNRGLSELIQEIKVPTEIVTEMKDNKKKEVERKIFPGYVMIKMIITDDSYLAVRTIRGVTGFVGASTAAPMPLSDEEVESIGIDKREILLSYSLGDSVKIVDGPLEGFTGIVDELEKGKNHVRVMISMFGRETPVELELDQVEIID